MAGGTPAALLYARETQAMRRRRYPSYSHWLAGSPGWHQLSEADREHVWGWSAHRDARTCRLVSNASVPLCSAMSSV